jgi:hypothetical protein
LVVALAGVLIYLGTKSSTSTSSPTTTSLASKNSTTVATTLGPVGEVAPWVVAENKRKGTTAWQIPETAAQNVIAGFANLDAAQVGDSVNFYVTTPSPSFQITAYRMGWYKGTGAREVWHSSSITGVAQPKCNFSPGINMTSCDNWSSSLTVKITKDFVQGDYLFKLVGSGGQEGYVPLTVWDPSSHATYLLVNRILTWQGWDAWGGFSFYQGTGPCAPGIASYPVCNRARVASLDRPYDQGFGASDFMGNEYPLLSYMEEHGLDLTYINDTTLDSHSALQSNHKVLLSLGHDETWTYNERVGAVNAEKAGTNIIFFGAAAVLRHARMQPSPLGPARQEVNYRSTVEDPLMAAGNDPMNVTGNTFAVPPTNLPPETMTGELYSGYLNGSNNVPFVVADGTGWIYKGTGLKTGDQLAGVVLSDIDHLSGDSQMPQNIQVFGHSPVPLSLAYTNQGTWNGFTYADLTYYTDPVSHAGIIDTGTVNWAFAMSSCKYAPVGCPTTKVQEITGNMLWLFGQGPAGVTTPSVPNFKTIQPPLS